MRHASPSVSTFTPRQNFVRLGLYWQTMKEVAKPWMVKVLTDLGTRLLVVTKPHLLVKDLQGNVRCVWDLLKVCVDPE